jgi:hypothetical protein
MNRQMSLFLFTVSILLLAGSPSAPAQAPDGTVKITSRTVAPAIGLEWGEGVLTYKGRNYPFTFRAGGRFRNVDGEITTVELSGQVFNLKNLEDFDGNYQTVEIEGPDSGGGTRARIKNQNGVVVNVASIVKGRKFNLTREGLDVQLKK